MLSEPGAGLSGPTKPIESCQVQRSLPADRSSTRPTPTPTPPGNPPPPPWSTNSRHSPHSPTPPTSPDAQTPAHNGEQPTGDQPNSDQASPDRSTSCEWVAPVTAPVVSGFRTAGRPSHNGVDLGAARSTRGHAAAAGTVITMRCNVNPASDGCDQDGSPSIRGCGWYVDLRHDTDITTRYATCRPDPPSPKDKSSPPDKSSGSSAPPATAPDPTSTSRSTSPAHQ
jgi:murein DD-endopeptidase MepM/ murein hydrolase activator NlpD